VEGDERLRLFCALLLPPSAVDGLVAWQTAELAPRVDKLRLVSPENLHVTLAFLGATPAARAGEVAEALREACAARERPLFGVDRYRETRSVAMIALTD
jgi:2'-5' RNA ligase